MTELSQSADVAAQARRLERDLSAIRRALRKPLEAEVARGGLNCAPGGRDADSGRASGHQPQGPEPRSGAWHIQPLGRHRRPAGEAGNARAPATRSGRWPHEPHPSHRCCGGKFVRDRIPELTSGPLERALARAHAGERGAIERALHRLRELLEPA